MGFRNSLDLVLSTAKSLSFCVTSCNFYYKPMSFILHLGMKQHILEYIRLILQVIPFVLPVKLSETLRNNFECLNMQQFLLL